MKILLIDDDQNITSFLQKALQEECFEVDVANTGTDGLFIAKTNQYDLIICDFILPGKRGDEICQDLRKEGVSIPILMLSVENEPGQKATLLNYGADDYLTKPFSGRELVVRVRALLRRTYRNSSPLADYLVFNDGDLEVDVRKFEVKKKGKLLSLTPNEIKVLIALLSNPGQVFTREQLVERAFGFDYEGFDRTVDTHIKNLRQKLEDDPKKPKIIINSWFTKIPYKDIFFS
jgi:DNA-binding response OmpR family regulator